MTDARLAVARRRDVVVGVVSAAGLVVALWLVLIPSAVFDVGEDGVPIHGGIDNYWPQMLTIPVLVVLASLFMEYVGRLRMGKTFSAVGVVVWSALFVWKVTTAKVDGANLWPVTFVIFIFPVSVAAVFVSFFFSLVWSGRARQRGSS